MNEPITSANGNVSTSHPADRRRASLRLLLLAAVGLLGVGAGGVYWWMPAKAEFRGKVTLDGHPLRGGQLTTWPDHRGVPRSVGFIGQDGEFALNTDIDGNYIEQAFVGRHRISIAQFALQAGASAPRLTSPAKYSSPDTSGLTLTVDRDSSKNFAVFALISDSPKSNDPPASAEGTLPPGSPAKPEAGTRDDSPLRPQ
ncbi:MAG: hypothetical protein FD138_2641 [Planctomycetota bacterium]|nr:MAG: hypothetical protein FD138_2641 [Planctomycetota bacterium]